MIDNGLYLVIIGLLLAFITTFNLFKPINLAIGKMFDLMLYIFAPSRLERTFFELGKVLGLAWFIQAGCAFTCYIMASLPETFGFYIDYGKAYLAFHFFASIFVSAIIVICILVILIYTFIYTYVMLGKYVSNDNGGYLGVFGLGLSVYGIFDIADFTVRKYILLASSAVIAICVLIGLFRSKQFRSESLIQLKVVVIGSAMIFSFIYFYDLIWDRIEQVY